MPAGFWLLFCVFIIAQIPAEHTRSMSGLTLPPLIHGSTSLGNIWKSTTYAEKKAMIAAMLKSNEDKDGPLCIDSAGKYGAGLALESIGRILSELKVDPSQVIISNKLAWLRAPLTGPEPTFEPGVWFDLEYDAKQAISYEGILECYRQGNELLAPYKADLVSVHDPDEYLAAASDPADRLQRLDDIKGAYRALEELKAEGKVKGIGVGSKTWSVIKEIHDEGVQLDWIMLANSLTIYERPPALLAFLRELVDKGVHVINSAVFHGGFLMGGSDFFDYQPVARETHADLYDWRDRLHETCARHGVDKALVCVQYALRFPGVQSLALASSRPARVISNARLMDTEVPQALWEDMIQQGLIDQAPPPASARAPEKTEL